ncbi:MAG: hypothetical protein ACI8X3_000258 [Saprospiraceae bacterium]
MGDLSLSSSVFKKRCLCLPAPKTPLFEHPPKFILSADYNKNLTVYS